MKNIKIISVMSETRKRNKRVKFEKFPAMLCASLKLKSDLFDKYPVEEIENENHYLFNPPTNYF